jgi:AraC family transcriptional regulator
VIDHVLTHLDQPHRLKNLAKLAHLSPFHFHRVFQAIVGETPSDFVRRLRLEKAIQLMAFSKRRSLTDIGLECGFTSSSDFSRSFKQRYGTSPRSFDVGQWRAEHGDSIPVGPAAMDAVRISSLARSNPDRFRVRIRDLPARTVAYIRISNPYQGVGVIEASARLVDWAEKNGTADHQWLGYQWENPEITPLEDCRYCVAVEAEDFKARGEVGSYQFPKMTVAEIEIRGDLALELRALQWIYGSWLPRSRYEPDDLPCFEAWMGRPFAHGFEHFELRIQLPVKQASFVPI